MKRAKQRTIPQSAKLTAPFTQRSLWEIIKDEHTYPDNNTAFDAGANALKDILNKLNLNY